MDLLLESIKIIRREIQVRQLRLQRYESRLVVKQLNVSVSDLEWSGLESPSVRRNSSEEHKLGSQSIWIVRAKFDDRTVSLVHLHVHSYHDMVNEVLLLKIENKGFDFVCVLVCVWSDSYVALVVWLKLLRCTNYRKNRNVCDISDTIILFVLKSKVFETLLSWERYFLQICLIKNSNLFWKLIGIVVLQIKEFFFNFVLRITLILWAILRKHCHFSLIGCQPHRQVLLAFTGYCWKSVHSICVNPCEICIEVPSITWWHLFRVCEPNFT